MELKLTKCDVCLREQSEPMGGPMLLNSIPRAVGWVRLVLIEATEPGKPYARLFRRVQEAVEKVEEPGQIIEQLGGLMEKFGADLSSPSLAPPTIDLCPFCAKTLEVVVNGQNMLDAIRHKEERT